MLGSTPDLNLNRFRFDRIRVGAHFDIRSNDSPGTRNTSDLWFRSSVKIGYPVGSLCSLFRRVTWFSLLLASYRSEIVPKSWRPTADQTTSCSVINFESDSASRIKMHLFASR
jgi:hypothetical protein